MRTRITGTAWFGPKRIGWGWSPRNWQGWLVTAVFVGLAIDSSFVFHGPENLIAVLVLFVVLLGVIALTGDGPG